MISVQNTSQHHNITTSQHHNITTSQHLKIRNHCREFEIKAKRSLSIIKRLARTATIGSDFWDTL